MEKYISSASAFSDDDRDIQAQPHHKFLLTSTRQHKQACLFRQLFLMILHTPGLYETTQGSDALWVAQGIEVSCFISILRRCVYADHL